MYAFNQQIPGVIDNGQNRALHLNGEQGELWIQDCAIQTIRPLSPALHAIDKAWAVTNCVKHQRW